MNLRSRRGRDKLLGQRNVVEPSSPGNGSEDHALGSNRVSYAMVNINKNLLGSLFYTHFVHGQLPVIWQGQQITIVGKRFDMLTEFEVLANKLGTE